MVHTATLVELMRAYARIKTRDDFTPLHLARGPVYTMEQALERMRGLLGTAIDWTRLSAWLPDGVGATSRSGGARPRRRASRRRWSWCKAGRLELRQDGAFQPIWLRPARGGGTMNETARGFLADGAFAVPPLPEQERMVEAVLFASRAPLTAREIAERLPQGCDVPEALAALRAALRGPRRAAGAGRRRLGVPHRRRTSAS